MVTFLNVVSLPVCLKRDDVKNDIAMTQILATGLVVLVRWCVRGAVLLLVAL